MNILEQIRTELAAANDPVDTMNAAGASFELIRQLANNFAVPQSAVFSTWALTAVAACEARNSLGCPVIAFPHEAIIAEQSADEDTAAEILAELAVTVQRSLEAAARQETSPERRRGLGNAAAVASEIRGLLATDG
jgi:hypothetical protein